MNGRKDTGNLHNLITSVAYSMMDEYPLDDDTDNDDSPDTSEGSVEKMCK